MQYVIRHCQVLYVYICIFFGLKHKHFYFYFGKNLTRVINAQAARPFLSACRPGDFVISMLFAMERKTGLSCLWRCPYTQGKNHSSNEIGLGIAVTRSINWCQCIRSRFWIGVRFGLSIYWVGLNTNKCIMWVWFSFTQHPCENWILITNLHYIIQISFLWK